MSEFMTCFACENTPTRQCPRCGRPYCDEHGEDVCDACLEPASGLPSFTLFRGSLVALLIGTILAIWLLVQPPGGASTTAQQPTQIAATSESVVETTPDITTTAIVGETPVTPVVVATPTPASTGGSTTYIVESGDTLSTICAEIAPALDSEECVDEIVALNGLEDASTIQVGQELIVPQ